MMPSQASERRTHELRQPMSRRLLQKTKLALGCPRALKLCVVMVSIVWLIGCLVGNWVG
jgi:hypothetical protein